MYFRNADTFFHVRSLIGYLSNSLDNRNILQKVQNLFFSILLLIEKNKFVCLKNNSEITEKVFSILLNLLFYFVSSGKSRAFLREYSLLISKNRRANP